jgi:hypothetical protein
MQDINKIIDELKSLNFRQFFKIIGKIRIKVFISIIAAFLIYTFFMFKAGQIYQVTAIAIPLCSPFDMALKIDEREISLEKIYFVKCPNYPGTKKMIALELRRIIKFAETEKVGTAIVNREAVQKFSIPEAISFISTAYAQNSFNWEGHEKNYNFKEKYKKSDTIRRYYKDGWVLEYKVDKNGRSIPSSFRWIKKG